MKRQIGFFSVIALMLTLLVYPQLPEALLNILLVACGALMILCLLLYLAQYLRMLHKQTGTDY